jgi:hypothetical protein
LESTVNVALTGAAPEIVALGIVEKQTFAKFAGELTVKLTVPAKAPAGVNVIAEVPVAPGAIETLAALNVKD